MRNKTTTVKFHGFITHTVRKLSPSPSQCSSNRHQSSGIPYPIAYFVNCSSFSTGHKNFRVAFTTITEPRSFKQAMKDPGWREVMHKEIQALEDNGTWSMETLPLGKHDSW